MIENRLLALTLSLVLITGVVTPAFADNPEAGIMDDDQPGEIKVAGAVPTDGTWFEFAITSEFAVTGCSGLSTDPGAGYRAEPS